MPIHHFIPWYGLRCLAYASITAFARTSLASVSVIFCFGALLHMSSSTTFAAGTSRPDMHVGFTLLSAWDTQSRGRIEVGVWYPTRSAPLTIQVGKHSMRVARGGTPESGHFPVILLSHVMAGNALIHHDTARALAQKGFVILAPTHRHDNEYDTQALFTANHIPNRLADLSMVFDFIHKKTKLGAIMDTNRLGAIGFDTGAAAVLIMAGAEPAPQKYREYCTETTTDSPYCSQWTTQRLQRMESKLPALLQQYMLPQPAIRAAALVAPGYAFLFGKEQLVDVNIPLHIFSAEYDSVNRGHASSLRDNVHTTPHFSILQSADNFSLRAPCPVALRATDEVMCIDRANTNRQAVHDTLNTALVKFFLHTLGTPSDTLPQSGL